MRHDESEPVGKDWKRIAAAFLRPPSKPSSLETAAFVSKVMSRLEAPAARCWQWPRWLVPAMSFAVAISAFLVARPDARFTPPEDVVLLSDSSGLTPQAAVPSTDDLSDMEIE